MYSRKIFYAAIFFLASLCLFSLPVSAQTRIGTIQGTVKDPNGAFVPNATVTITQPNTGYRQTAQTDDQGVFKLVNIPFSDYTVRAEASGFKGAEQHIDVESAVPFTLDFSLTIGET